MVLAMAGGARRAFDRPQRQRARDDAAALHERLVAYVHALSDPHEARTGVWMEHSYARARGAAPPAAGDARVLLAPRHTPAPRPDADIDVERPDPPPPDLFGDDLPQPFGETDDDADDENANVEWEERVTAHAPTAVCARLVERVAEILRAQRLAVLARGGIARRDAARAACRRLRAALAPTWTAFGAQPRAPSWLHSTLTTHLPRQFRSLYEETLTELRRSAPRLADRMGVARTAGSPLEPEPAEGLAVARDASPWLVWLESGGARGRWARRLRSLVHTRALPVDGGSCATPEVWCANAAATARAALADILAEAGDRSVVLGGAGGGAALAAALATDACAARVRGLVLVAPLLGAGARAWSAEPLAELRLPVLLAAGAGGASAARALCARGPARRVLEARGADRSLRAHAGLRARLRLPQRALDAAVAEECVRWTLEVSEGGAGAEGAEAGRSRRSAPPSPSPPPPAPKFHSRRSPAASDSKYFYPRSAPRGDSEPAPDDAAAHHTVSTAIHASPRAIEIVEGRVVSRVSGGTPLALLPPRRAPAAGSAAAAVPLAAADIMQMPIVFADDEHAADAAGARGSRRGRRTRDSHAGAGAGAGAAARGALTVRSGRAAGAAGAAMPYARVIVAKRGGGGGGGGGAGGAQGVVLRRAARRDRN